MGESSGCLETQVNPSDRVSERSVLGEPWSVCSWKGSSRKAVGRTKRILPKVGRKMERESSGMGRCRFNQAFTHPSLHKLLNLKKFMEGVIVVAMLNLSMYFLGLTTAFPAKTKLDFYRILGYNKNISINMERAHHQSLLPRFLRGSIGDFCL